MNVENELRRLYRDAADPCLLGGIDCLLRRALNLNIFGVNRRAVYNLKKKQQTSLHITQARQQKIRSK